MSEGGLQFNLSHSGDMLVVAVARGRAVGVDVEKIKKGMSFYLIFSGPIEKHIANKIAIFAPCLMKEMTFMTGHSCEKK